MTDCGNVVAVQYLIVRRRLARIFAGKIASLLAGGLLPLAAPLFAQDPILALDPTTMVGYAGTVAADQYARRDFGARVVERRPTRQPVNPVTARAQLSYRPNADVRQKVYARAVAQAQKTNPGEAAKLRRLLESGAVTRDIGGYLGRYGMSSTNVADTTALYLALAWQITRGAPNDPSRATMIGLRNQVATTFAGMPAFIGASDATKQDLSEANISQAAYAANMGNAMEKDRSLLPRARAAMAKSVMSLYGLNLLKLDLTPQGLR